MKVLIVTDCSFPGSALASRLLSFAYLFNDLGHEVHIVSTKTDSKRIGYENVYYEKQYTYEILGSEKSERLQSFLGNEKLKEYVDTYLESNNVGLMFMTSLGSNFSSILRTARQHKVKTILEQCEWLDSSSFGLGKCDPRFIRFSYHIYSQYKKADGIISISRLLNDYYLSKGINTIRIPSILDVQNKPYELVTNNKRINIVYTGNTSHSKELLKPIFEALASKSKYLENITFNIYGSNEKQVLRNIGNDCKLYQKVVQAVVINGKVPQKDIEGILLKADYQMFIRPNRRSSNAGFPTKLAESMSVGTPVITNETGDISLYLKDGINGYLCKDNTTEAIREVFDKIINVSRSSYSILRRNARKTAEDSFDYRNYLEEVKNLIKKL